MQYIIEWRMTLARAHLRADDVSVARTATPSATVRPSPSPQPSAATTESHPEPGGCGDRQRQTHVPSPHTPDRNPSRAATGVPGRGSTSPQLVTNRTKARPVVPV